MSKLDLVIVLAAGDGTRMKSDKAKVLHEIAGRSIIENVLAAIAPISAKNTTVVVGADKDAVVEHISTISTKIKTVEQKKRNGTGGAAQLALAEHSGDGTVLILAGDTPLLTTQTLQEFLDAHHNDKNQASVLTSLLPDPTGYGRIIRAENGLISQIVEEKDANLAIRSIQEINTGIMVLPTEELGKWLKGIKAKNAQGEYYLTDVIAMAVRDGVPIRSAQARHEHEILGVNSRDQLAGLERQLQRQRASALLDLGVTVFDPERIDIRGELVCGQDVWIDVGCVFEGRVKLAAGVRVGPYCIIKNAEIAAGSEVGAFTHIDGAKIGPDARIGPYARIRPGSELAKEVHIGNFVEVKNSKIAANSKANHLAYVGDAVVGSRVNIGAGTITCNYDGVNKHQTIIEDDVFIGSDTQLVAPVRVGRGATLGAGTTLTKDAPANQLTVSRAKQISLQWQRPVKQEKKSPSKKPVTKKVAAKKIAKKNAVKKVVKKTAKSAAKGRK